MTSYCHDNTIPLEVLLSKKKKKKKGRKMASSAEIVDLKYEALDLTIRAFERYRSLYIYAIAHKYFKIQFFIASYFAICIQSQ